VGAYVQENTFLDPTHGVDAQQLWLGLLRAFADRVNPGFGQIEYGYDTTGITALEWSLPPDVELEERDPNYTVAHCREYLRGYSWLTVVPAELAERVGGADALRRTGAFAEVSPLKAGGVWLLATQDYRDYAGERVEQVFHALAPILRPGQPRPMGFVIDAPPQRLVFQDASGAARND
jgi:hypothetical protein